MTSIHGGRIHDYMKQTGKTLSEIFDFSANINPLGPPESVRAAILDALEDIRHYPDAMHRQVKRVIGARFNISEDMLVCGNGASEVFELFFRHARPKRTFILHPAFAEYALTAARYGSNIVDVMWPLDKSLIDVLLEIDGQINRGDVVVLNNPHNPTGRLVEKELWQGMVERWNEREVYVLMDESFLDFVRHAEAYTAIHLVSKLPFLFVVRSATKMYSIPGLRFGFGIGCAEITKQIDANRDGWSVNHLAQAAASVAYQDIRFEQDTWAWLAEEQDYIERTWGREEAWQWFKPGVNFFLVAFNPEDSSRLTEHLQSSGMFVRSCANFLGLSQDYVRIAIRTRSENERLWQAALEFFNLSL